MSRFPVTTCYWLATLLFLCGWWIWAQIAPGLDGSLSILPSILGALILLIPAAVVYWLIPRLSSHRITLSGIVLAALAVRVLLLSVDPFLSDDLWRYLWDGEVQRSGIDPYLAAPADAVLDPVAMDPHWNEVRSRVNHPAIRTIYPPMSQLWFRFVALGETGWRIFTVLLDLAVGAVLAVALRRRGRDPREAVLWWWHPLPILECAVGAHVEVLALLMTVVAFFWLDGQKGTRALVMLGAAIATKFLPLGWIPLFLNKIGYRRGWLLLVAGILSGLPYLDSHFSQVTEGLREFSTGWYSGDILFRPVGFLIGIDPENRHDSASQYLRLVFLATWLAACWYCRKMEPWRGFLLVSLAFVLLTPTLHPWYLLWLLAPAVMERSGGSILLCATILLQYRVLDGWWAQQSWEMPDGTRWLVISAPLLWFIVSECRRRFSSGSVLESR
ncbi:MAG: glycosyltransferase 87 family protein [Planctomycetota bacterium]|nr:glycosyltransferase 87 family protein [Planctomycetota bacterium]